MNKQKYEMGGGKGRGMLIKIENEKLSVAWVIS